MQFYIEHFPKNKDLSPTEQSLWVELQNLRLQHTNHLFKKLKEILYRIIIEENQFLNLLMLIAKKPALINLLIKPELNLFWEGLYAEKKLNPAYIGFQMMPHQLNTKIANHTPIIRPHFATIAGLWCKSYYLRWHQDQKIIKSLSSYTTTGRIDDARKVINQLSDTIQATWPVHILKAYLHYASNQIIDAAILLQKNVKGNQNNLLYLKSLLQCYYQLGYLKQCIDLTNKITALNPLETSGYYYIINLLYQNNCFNEINQWADKLPVDSFAFICKAVIIIRQIRQNYSQDENKITDITYLLLESAAKLSLRKNSNSQFRIYCIYLILNKLFAKLHQYDIARIWQQKAANFAGAQSNLPSYRHLKDLNLISLCDFIIKEPLTQLENNLQRDILNTAFPFLQDHANELKQKAEFLLHTGELLGDYSCIETLNQRDLNQIKKAILEKTSLTNKRANKIVARAHRAANLHYTPGLTMQATTSYHLGHYYHRQGLYGTQLKDYADQQKSINHTTLANQYFQNSIFAINKAIMLKPYCKKLINNAHFGFGISSYFFKGINNFEEMKAYYLQHTPTIYQGAHTNTYQRSCSSFLIN